MINPPKPPALIKSSFLKSPWIPGVLAAGVATTIALNSAGLIALPHINLPYLLQSNVNNTQKEGDYTFQPGAAAVGKPFKYDFGPGLIQKLEPQGREAPGIYSFYLGSGVGFPPMGLTLDPLTGVLSGTPKERLAVAADSKFEVCVKDVGGKSACRTYVLPVAPKAAVAPKPAKKSPTTPKTAPASTQTSSCPANSHFNPTDSTKCACDTGYETNSAGNGCALIVDKCPTAVDMGCGTVVPDGIRPIETGGFRLDGRWLSNSCACPSDTEPDSSVSSPAGTHYCQCNR